MARKDENLAPYSLLTRKGHAVDLDLVCLDYPFQDEVISYPSYSIRVRAMPAAASVEVAIDQRAWRPCREALGFWWYDWTGYEDGEHEVVARIRKPDGAFSHCIPHQFQVRITQGGVS